MNVKNILVLTSIFILVGCGGGGTSTPTVASQELLDPNAAAGNEFGYKTTILTNGNIVVASPNDDTVATNAGVVHLYNPFTKTVVASFYGDTASDQLGFNGVTALGNNNFVIASAEDNVNSVTDAGSIRQIDTTGTQVSIIAGAATNDMSNISVTDASAHNFYVVSLSKFDNYSMTDSGFATVVAY